MKFEQWWNTGAQSPNNPYKADSPAFWAWEGWQAGVGIEREECAQVCEEGGKDESGRIHVQAWGAAKAIRARGEK
jgi:hypothetical protein